MEIGNSVRAPALIACLALALFVSPSMADDDEQVSVANLNILHGFACGPPVPEGDQCRVVDRIDLLLQHIEAVDCPDIITLQENVTEEFVPVAQGEVGPLRDTVSLIEDGLAFLDDECDFDYEILFDPEVAAGPPRGIDEELILSRYPVLDAELLPLYSPLAPFFFFRHVLFARIDHPAGPIDVFTTHLAAESDFGSEPCGSPILPMEVGGSPPCPAECIAPDPDDPEGEFDTVRECQAKQMANFIENRHDVPNPAFATGDFNTEPFTNAYGEFADRGWLDSHLAGGNVECDPVSGSGCTSGREDRDLSDLESPALNVDRRIDFIFVVPAEEGASCAGRIVPADNNDFDEIETGLFAAVPNPLDGDCGAAPDAICWPSDHSGNIATLDCGDDDDDDHEDEDDDD